MEQRDILENCEEIIGSDFSTYTEQLKELIKKEKKKEVKISNDDISSGSSQSHQIYGINIWSLGHTHATVKFVLLPKIITSHLMQEKNLNYKEVLILMYGKVPRTEHHLKLLINVSVSIA